MIEFNIEEDDVGDLETAAFNIIRLRKIKEMPKVHEIMRKLPKYCRDSDGKKELLRLGRDVDLIIPPAEQFDDDGNELTPKEIDDKWVANNKKKIAYHVHKAAHFNAELTKKETPIELLRAAYKKLMHDNMNLDEVNVADYSMARKLAVDIKNRAKEIEQTMYEFEKNFKRLKNKK